MPTSYDDFPYPSHAYEATTPDRLGMQARIFGIPSRDPSAANVLELGCASGGNLLPLAFANPDARFHGIDLSAEQIADGRRRRDELGIGNARLEVADLATFEPEPGAYDYVVCHGVYSWVSADLRERILAICRRALREHGVALVSCNVWPGWRLEGVIRDAMLALSSGDDELRLRAAGSRHVLAALGSSVGGESAYGRILGRVTQRLAGASDSYLAHEHLETHNEPVWLDHFVARAEDNGLRYLGDASLSRTIGHLVDPALRMRLASLSPDLVDQQQYLDFFRCATFRSNVLVRGDEPVSRWLDTFDPTTLHLTAPPDRDDASGLAASLPGAEELLQRLHEAWPASLPYVEAAGGLDAGQWVLAAAATDLLGLSLRPSPAAKSGPGVRGWAYARHEAREHHVVTSLHHRMVPLDPGEAFVLTRLDGRPHESITAELDEAWGRLDAITGETRETPDLAAVLASLESSALLVEA